MKHLLIAAFAISLTGSCDSRKPEKVTLATSANPIDNFLRAKPGMTPTQTAMALGANGELVDSSTVAGTKTIVYRWQNRDGSSIDGTFQNGKLIMIQAGVE